MSGNHEVFPVSRASYLDGWWRRLKYQPGRLADRYVRPGDTVLDIGCGPGLFSRAIARRVGENGQVIAVDLQEGMLEILKEKATQEGLLARIRFHKAEPQSLVLEYPGRINVAFGFCVVHEVPDPARLMQEVFSLLVSGGTFLIAEPKHEVSADEFDKTLAMAASVGFRRVGTPFVLRSHTALLMKMGKVSPITVNNPRWKGILLLFRMNNTKNISKNVTQESFSYPTKMQAVFPFKAGSARLRS